MKTSSHPTEITTDRRDGERRSRRTIIAGAGVATAALLAKGERVSAGNGDAILLGRTDNTSTQETVIAGPYLTVRDGTSEGSLARTIDGVPNDVATGVHGFTGGAPRSRAIWGQSETDDGVGVYGGHWSQTPGIGVVGESANGAGVWARGTDDDLALIGTGRLRFIGTQGLSPTAPGSAGTLAREANGSLWYCFATNRWQQIAGPTTAGGFTPLDPTRVYDSRLATPLFGKLPSGQNRVLSVAFGRSVTTGAVVDNDLVPVGATAVTYNLTATGTINSGFLAIAPGNVNVVGASTLNWTATNDTIANAGTVKLDTNRQINVICGGVQSGTDFLLDITGYYR